MFNIIQAVYLWNVFSVCLLKLTLQFASKSHFSHFKELWGTSLSTEDIFLFSMNFFFLAAFLWIVDGDFILVSPVLNLNSSWSRLLKLKENPFESLTQSLKGFWLDSICLEKSRHWVNTMLSILMLLGSHNFKLFWRIQKSLRGTFLEPLPSARNRHKT